MMGSSSSPMTPPRAFPFSSSIPFELVPASRPTSPSYEASVTLLAKRFDLSDASRRKTGLLHIDGGVGIVLPPLLSTRIKGSWSASPWSSSSATPAFKVHKDYDEGFDEIPRDMDQWEEWRIDRDEKDQTKKKKKLPSQKINAASGSGRSASDSLATTVQHNSQQGEQSNEEEEIAVRTSLVGIATSTTISAVASTSTSTTRVNLVQQPVTYSLHTSKSPSSSSNHSKPHPSDSLIRSSAHAFIPHPSTSSTMTIPAARAVSVDGGSPTTARALSKKAIVDVVSHSEPNLKRPRNSPVPRTKMNGVVSTLEDEMVLIDEDEEGRSPPKVAGRSLGEDEEILYEQGCTQMEVPPTTQGFPFSSPVKTSSKPPLSRAHTLPHFRSSAPPNPLPSPTSTPPRPSRVTRSSSAFNSPPSPAYHHLQLPPSSSSTNTSKGPPKSSSPMSSSHKPNGTANHLKRRSSSVSVTIPPPQVQPSREEVIITSSGGKSANEGDSEASIPRPKPLSSFQTQESLLREGDMENGGANEEDVDEIDDEDGLPNGSGSSQGKNKKRKVEEEESQASSIGDEVEDITEFLNEDLVA